MRLNKILHPTDYSDASEEALRYAAALAHDHGARLVILHVVDTLGPEDLSYGEMAAGPQPASYRKQLWSDLHKVRPPDADVSVQYVLAEENPARAILRAAAELGCDLIVLGSHGRSGFRHWMEGGVAEAVVRAAPCPVLVVKPPAAVKPPPPFHATEMHPGLLVEKDV